MPTEIDSRDFDDIDEDDDDTVFGDDDTVFDGEDSPPTAKRDEFLDQLAILEDQYKNAYVPFGKYRDYSLFELIEEDIGYLDWMIRAYGENFFDADFINDWLEENLGLLQQARSFRGQRLVAKAPPLSLTSHQMDVVDQIQDAIDRGLPIMRLEGGAGYGKSYATKAIAREAIRCGISVRACAVSYVATEVLRAQLDDIGVQCDTLAKTLLFEKVWKEDAEVYQHSDGTPYAAREVLADGSMLIVDECSMILDRDAHLLFETVKDGRAGTLVLVGDSFQLPPVGQDTVSICCGDWDRGVATLTQPMRYDATSPLYEVEQVARAHPESLTLVAKMLEGNQVKVASNAEEMIQAFVDNYKADPAALHRMMLFRRVSVNAANNAIRRLLFGEDAPVVVEDERLMILATADYPYAVTEAQKLGQIRYYSGESFRVTVVVERDYLIAIDNVRYEIPYYHVQFDADGISRSARIIFAISDSTVDESKMGGPEFIAARRAAVAYGKKVDEMNHRVGNWEPLRRLNADFVKVAYQYATSVHRAQGQTCDYAYCRPGELLAIRGIMGRALCYVSATRARKQLTVQV